MLSYGVSPDMVVRKEFFGGMIKKLDNAPQDFIGYVNDVGYFILDICSQTPATVEKIHDVLDAHGIETEIKDIEDFCTVFEKKGYLLKEKNDYSHSYSLDTEFPQKKVLSSPVELDLYPTMLCNQRCSFCYLPREMLSQKEHMEEHTLKNIFNQCTSAKVIAINILGGEPFMYPEIVEKAIELHNEKILLNITTNGTAIPHRLHETLTGKTIYILFSIHSSIPQIHDKKAGMEGAFIKAMHSARKLIKKGAHVGIQMVITSENSPKDIFRLFRMSKNMGAHGFFINFPYCGKWMDYEYYSSLIPGKWFYNITKALEILRETHESMNILYKGGLGFALRNEIPTISSPLEALNTGCEGGVTGLEVMPNGDVYPCCLSLGIQKFRLGNINETTLHKLWNSPLLHGFRNREKMVPPESRCRECSFFALCKGGCFMSSLYAFGRIQGDPACPMIRGIENE